MLVLSKGFFNYGNIGFALCLNLYWKFMLIRGIL